MVIKIDEIMKIPEILAECKGMRTTMKWSFRSSLFATSCSMVGFVCGGPVGMVTGSAVGSFVAYVYTRDKFKSAYTVYCEEFTLEQKERLQKKLNEIIKNLDVKDVFKLASILRSDKALFELFKKTIKHFMSSELKKSKQQV